MPGHRRRAARYRLRVAELDDLLASSIYSDTGWDSLAKPVGEYHQGRPESLVSAHTSHGGTVNGSQLAYNCVDSSWPKDWNTWHRDTEQAAHRSPLFAWLNSWYTALTGSKLVVADSGNHGQYLQDSNPCLDGYGTTYLESGKLPDTDKTCPAPPPRP